MTEPSDSAEPPSSVAARAKQLLIGRKRELQPGVFHKVSLIALLAWIGLGADGLSSSSYGPEEAFRQLGEHTYLAVGLAFAVAFTVIIISYAYSRIIEQFPLGGGGYVVASRLLGRRAGVTSGSALVVDYILTVAISIAAAGDALFSFLPPHWSGMLVLGVVPAKLLIEIAAIGFLILLNLRGVKESVLFLAPIFLTFLVTHAILILGVIASRAGEIPAVVDEVRTGLAQDLRSVPTGLGLLGVLALFLRAYSLGGGTYTGIEAVSNGLSIMREPKVQTGKRTMALMAGSLAATASGLILAYLLLHIAPVEGRTMNAVLVDAFAGHWRIGTLAIGSAFVLVTLLSEALLLVVAAQAGFIDGPRVMANMAVDSYLPHRFSQLSDRLTMHYGVFLIGGTSLLALLYTRGRVSHLVVMYAINVFVTFSLSQLAMCRFWLRERRERRPWGRPIVIHVIGLVLCVFILLVTVYEKFLEGGWVTLALTGALIGLCALIHRHYRKVQWHLRRLDDVLAAIPTGGHPAAKPLERTQPTAVLLVGAYAGLGIHCLLSIQRLFPNHYRNFVFASVGVVDSASFTNVSAVEEVRDQTRRNLEQYVALATALGLAAEYRMAVDTEPITAAETLCRQIGKDYPRAVFFAGKLIFERERWYQRLLHNETGYQLQRQLQFAGLNAMVLPVRVLETKAA